MSDAEEKVDESTDEIESLEARLAHATTCAQWAAKLLRCFASSRPVPDWEKCVAECEAL
jgi:hypothetical protein